jgi:adenine-specific DNA-methyltransferase
MFLLLQTLLKTYYLCLPSIFQFFVTLPKVVNIQNKPIFIMYAIGHILKDIREEMGLQLQTVQEHSGIDQTQLSRIENGKRLPTIEQIKKLSAIYNFDDKMLLVQRESDKILTTMEYPEIAIETLKVAEDKLVYGKRYLTLFQDSIFAKPIGLESRRYIGSKANRLDYANHQRRNGRCTYFL